MQQHGKTVRCVFRLVLLCTAVCVTSWAGDWPTYRHDPGRSGIAEEHLQTPLRLQWTHVPAHPPRPAWPEPGRELNRLAFDYAHAVVAANGLVLFGSSADHGVYALDIASRGLLKFPPANGRGFQPVVIAPDEATRPRNVTVRLHFAESDEVKPGTRVADITNECRIGWVPSLSSAFTRKPGRRFSVVFGHAHRRCARKHGYARHRTLPAVNRLERLPAEAGTLAGMG